MFVRSCINVIIITLFYTNCTRGLAKTKLGYTLTEPKIFDWGAAPAPPLNTPMFFHAYCTTMFGEIKMFKTLKATYMLIRLLYAYSSL